MDLSTYAAADKMGAASLLIFIFGFVVFFIYIVAVWKVYKKAGKPGWASIIPFYSTYVLLKIAGRPGWWFLLYFVPIVQLVINIIVSIDIAKKFSRSTLFGIFLIWLLPLIGFVILSEGKSQYMGVDANPPQQPNNPPTQQPPVAQPQQPAQPTPVQPGIPTQ